MYVTVYTCLLVHYKRVNTRSGLPQRMNILTCRSHPDARAASSGYPVRTNISKTVKAGSKRMELTECAHGNDGVEADEEKAL